MVKSVTGTVDGYGVIFRQSGGTWNCAVPTDWKDGQYICSFVAENDAGELGYWKGILYLTDGNLLCPRLEADDLVIWMLPEREEKLEADGLTIWLLPERAERG